MPVEILLAVLALLPAWFLLLGPGKDLAQRVRRRERAKRERWLLKAKNFIKDHKRIRAKKKRLDKNMGNKHPNVASLKTERLQANCSNEKQKETQCDLRGSREPQELMRLPLPQRTSSLPKKSGDQEQHDAEPVSTALSLLSDDLARRGDGEMKIVVPSAVAKHLNFLVEQNEALHRQSLYVIQEKSQVIFQQSELIQEKSQVIFQQSELIQEQSQLIGRYNELAKEQPQTIKGTNQLVQKEAFFAHEQDEMTRQLIDIGCSYGLLVLFWIAVIACLATVSAVYTWWAGFSLEQLSTSIPTNTPPPSHHHSAGLSNL